ncbi:YidH family protein [Pseudomonas putida]|uniref:YidH family protein n=1 Tax=Pseudomonas putida TaxID=303 RepID=UPI00383AD024
MQIKNWWRSLNPQNHGEAPDPRFTLANERTFLAWIRTGLAFLAAAMALELIPDTLLADSSKRLAVIAALLVVIFIGLSSALRWRSIELALRTRRPLPMTGLIPLLSLALLVCVGVAVWVLYR